MEKIFNFLGFSKDGKIAKFFYFEKNKTDFGMTLNLSDKECEISSLYFGMPYG